ncbi:peroxidase-related enzyme [Roseiflexus castenholzii]|uniref:peroxidase-related enzyme n=1 Tax=Roseiflexus castenholzii TaxID=120962 RepID=UPI003C7C6292
MDAPEHPISRFPLPVRIDELPPDIRERIEQVAVKSGFVPNIFLALAHRPDEFRAFFAHHDALMSRPSNLSQAEKEMIVVATSAVNDCLYCVIAHGAILRIRSKNPRLAEQIAANYRRAEITPRQRAMLDYAQKVAVDSARISDDDWQPLYQHGFTQEDIWEIGAIAAFFAMSNRLANMSALRPNDEFYGMGR